MDCMDTDFKDNSFDIIIDKGTQDAIWCGFNSYFNVAKYLWEVKRILKPDGVYCLITYTPLKDRLPLLAHKI